MLPGLMSTRCLCCAACKPVIRTDKSRGGRLSFEGYLLKEQRFKAPAQVCEVWTLRLAFPGWNSVPRNAKRG